MTLGNIQKRKRILILTSTPDDLGKINVENECKEIKKSLNYVNNINKIELIQEHAATINDLYQLVDKFKPNIIHFSGHGNNTGIYLQDDFGTSKQVSTESLIKLFSIYNESIECVVLNSCFSEDQAQGISKFIPYVIGTKKEIKDTAAISFSKGFYEKLSESNDYEEAFEIGSLRVGLDNYQERNNLIIYSHGQKLKIISGGKKKNNNVKIDSEVSLPKRTQQILAFFFGSVFLSIIIAIAIIIPDPTPFSYTVFRITLAIAAAGCAAMIPSFVELSISTTLRAGGSLVLFLIIYFYNPASEIITNLSNAKPVLGIPKVVDFRTIELGNENAEFVFTSAFSYENEAEPSKTAKVNLEKVDLSINNKKIDLTWRYFVDHNIGKKNGWLGIKSTAAPFSVNQGERNYHETMFIQTSIEKISWKKFVDILDNLDNNELNITLSSITNDIKLDVLCIADIDFYRKKVIDYRKTSGKPINRITLPCKNKPGL